jgi:serine/threonine protein kinase
LLNPNFEKENNEKKNQDKNLSFLEQQQNKQNGINGPIKLSSGNFGEVKKYAITLENKKEKEFVVKRIKTDKTGMISDITDFYKECYIADQILTSMNNGELLENLKNMVIPYAYSKSSLGYLPDGKLYDPILVSEFCNSEDLKGYLEKQKVTKAFTYGKFINFCQQICNGMIYLHSKGILHLDLACRNILCHQEENDDMTLKISDFGLAEFLEEEEGTVPSHKEINDFMNITQNFNPKSSDLYVLSRELLSNKITGFEDGSEKKTAIQELERKIRLTVSKGGSRGGARDAIRAKEKFIDMMGPKVYKSYITTLYNQAKQQYLSGGFQTVRKNSKKAVGAKGRGIKVGGAKGKKGYVRHNKSVVKLKKKTRKYIKKKSHKKKS